MHYLTHHFLTCYIYFRVKAYRELNLVGALDEDTRVFSFFSSFFGPDSCSLFSSCDSRGSPSINWVDSRGLLHGVYQLLLYQKIAYDCPYICHITLSCRFTTLPHLIVGDISNQSQGSLHPDRDNLVWEEGPGQE